MKLLIVIAIQAPARDYCAKYPTVRICKKSNRKDKRECDFILYKERNLIERLFGKLKQFRAIPTRYDKLARNFLGALRLVAAVIQLNWGQALVDFFESRRGILLRYVPWIGLAGMTTAILASRSRSIRASAS
jgi:Transposase DDE domain